ncbi:MAG: hypothetical protein JXK05_08415 [Campylobacterales bacterium]|nr:hypothetical protein [Campylobacterales bacterium]
MNYPEFFETVTTITLYDPLSRLLGASSDGLLRFCYLDAVKLAGHSCPTVAGAYLMSVRSLEALYGAQTPQRGGVIVTIGGRRDEGVHGVIGAVAGLICGAAGEEGFKGLGGVHARCHLLRFDPQQSEPMRLQRIDNGHVVAAHYDPSRASLMPIDPELKAAAMGLPLDLEAQRRFGEAWQRNVEAIMNAASEVVRIEAC